MSNFPKGTNLGYWLRPVYGKGRGSCLMKAVSEQPGKMALRKKRSFVLTPPLSAVSQHSPWTQKTVCWPNDSVTPHCLYSGTIAFFHHLVTRDNKNKCTDEVDTKWTFTNAKPKRKINKTIQKFIQRFRRYFLFYY